MQHSTDTINEHIHMLEPGETRLIGKDELSRMTQSGWRLVGIVMEKRFMSTNPQHYGHTTGIFCDQCRLPVHEDFTAGHNRFQRSDEAMVEVAMFLVIRGRDEVLADLHKRLGDSSRSYNHQISELERQRDEHSARADEAEKEFSSTEAALEEKTLAALRSAKAVGLHHKALRRAEAVLGRLRDELGAARWRELVGDLESSEHEAT